MVSRLVSRQWEIISCLLCLCLLATAVTTYSQSPAKPLAASRDEALRNLAEEDAELDYLFHGHEVSLEDYRLTRARNWVTRRYLMGLPSQIIDLPEYLIITKPEFASFFQRPPGAATLKAGQTYEGHWTFKGKMQRV